MPVATGAKGEAAARVKTGARVEAMHLRAP